MLDGGYDREVGSKYKKTVWDLPYNGNFKKPNTIYKINEIFDSICYEYNGKKNYRRKLDAVFKKKCVISQTDVSECEGAHIVPKAICKHFNLNFIFHWSNGILLSRNIHSSFDNFFWTFDIYDFKQIPSQPNWIYFSIIVINNNKKYTIRQYQFDQSTNTKKYYKLPIQSLPYLYIHYHIFFTKNYTIIRCNDHDLYKNFFDDKTFKQILHNPNKFFQIVSSHRNSKTKTYKYILDKKYNIQSQTIYQVLWNFYPHSMCSWERDKYLNDKKPITDFENLLSQKYDPNYLF